MGEVYRVAFSPDGTRLATASLDRTAKVWDAASGEELLRLYGHTNRVLGIAFSPDGTRLATASMDRTAKVWDAASGQELLSLYGHTNSLDGIAYSLDGTRLATASWDRAARVWDAASGQQLLTLNHTSDVASVAFSPDGTRLATASGDKTARLYVLNVEDLMSTARRRVTRSLTLEECKKYLHLEDCPSTVMAIELVVKGKNLATAGNVDDAAASFRKALELDPSLALDPEAEARQLAAKGLVVE
jgi:WD40 repeat protein